MTDESDDKLSNDKKSEAYNEGMDSAKEGDSSPTPFLELGGHSDEYNDSRQKGYEDGQTAEATGEAVAKNSEDSDDDK